MMKLLVDPVISVPVPAGRAASGTYNRNYG